MELTTLQSFIGLLDTYFISLFTELGLYSRKVLAKS